MNTTLGWFFGANAEIKFVFDVTCKCGARWQLVKIYWGWGVGDASGSTYVCRSCKHVLAYASRENDNFGGLEAISAEMIRSLLLSGRSSV